jgi:hypothetical protein
VCRKTTLDTKAQRQLDKATLRGVGLILRERIGRIGRIGRIACSADEAQTANVEFVKVLGGLLNHGAVGENPNQAALLKAFTDSPTADPGQISAAQAAIDATFGCP